MSARKLQSYLGANSTLAALTGQVEHLLVLQRLWESLAPPPLAHTCRVSGVQDRVIVVYASNGAIAAKARQLAPTILEKFQKKGLEVTAILVRVQARMPAEYRKPIKTLRLGAAGAERLRQLAGRLDESPLRRALERMLERHAEQDDAAHGDQGDEYQEQD